MFLNKVLVKYLHAQAMRGSITNQHMLGKHYYLSEPEYWAKAYAWLSIAADQGHEKAKQTVASLEAKLNQDLLDTGRKLQEDYKREINKKFFFKKTLKK